MPGPRRTRPSLGLPASGACDGGRLAGRSVLRSALAAPREGKSAKRGPWPLRTRGLAWWIAFVVVAAGSWSAEASWIFRPSYFSHDPQSGQRVAQYAPGAAPYALGEANYQQSGYRHYRSSIRGADGSADRLHMVETWGAGEYIRPYGEWLRPFRAGATPYGPWGNPYGPWTRPFDSWMNPYGLGRLWPSPYLPGFGSPGRPGFGGPRPSPSRGRPGGPPDGDAESP